MTGHTIPHSDLQHGWRKSSYSGPDAGSCLEVLDAHPHGIPVRDSKVPDGPAIVFPAAGWSLFLTAVKAGMLRT